jgi:hypothetical protein
MRSTLGAVVCGVLTACVGTEEPGFDCEEVAITDADGNPDPCDVAACEACNECDGGCVAIEDSYPPHYVCQDASFDVYDFCPDWELPTTTAAPRSENVVDLGCGGEDTETLTATSTAPGTIAVTHIDYLLGCCPTEVQVDVAAAGQVLTVGYTLVDDFCECACMLDVSYDIVNVPAGAWTIEAGPYATSTTVTVL